MNEKRKCLVGHDSDDGAILALIMAIIVVMIVVAIIVYGGAFIGGFHSLKNCINGITRYKQQNCPFPVSFFNCCKWRILDLQANISCSYPFVFTV